MADDIQIVDLRTGTEPEQDEETADKETNAGPSAGSSFGGVSGPSVGVGTVLAVLTLFGVGLVAVGLLGASGVELSILGVFGTLRRRLSVPGVVKRLLGRRSDETQESADSGLILRDVQPANDESQSNSASAQGTSGPTSRDRPQMSVAHMDAERDVEEIVDTLMRTSEQRPLPDASGIFAPICRPLAATLEGIPQELGVLRRDVGPALIGVEYNGTTTQRLASTYDLMLVVSPHHEANLERVMSYLPALIQTDDVRGLGSFRTFTIPAPESPGTDQKSQATIKDLRGHKGEPRHSMARTEPDFIAMSAPPEWSEPARNILSDYAPVLEIIEWDVPEIHVAGFVFDSTIDLPDHIVAGDETPSNSSTGDSGGTVPSSRSGGSSSRAPGDDENSNGGDNGGSGGGANGSLGDEMTAETGHIPAHSTEGASDSGQTARRSPSDDLVTPTGSPSSAADRPGDGKGETDPSTRSGDSPSQDQNVGGEDGTDTGAPSSDEESSGVGDSPAHSAAETTPDTGHTPRESSGEGNPSGDEADSESSGPTGQTTGDEQSSPSNTDAEADQPVDAAKTPNPDEQPETPASESGKGPQSGENPRENPNTPTEPEQGEPSPSSSETDEPVSEEQSGTGQSESVPEGDDGFNSAVDPTELPAPDPTGGKESTESDGADGGDGGTTDRPSGHSSGDDEPGDKSSGCDGGSRPDETKTSGDSAQEDAPTSADSESSTPEASPGQSSSSGGQQSSGGSTASGTGGRPTSSSDPSGSPAAGKSGSSPTSGSSSTTPDIPAESDLGPGIVPFGEAPASTDPSVVDVTEHVLNELTFQATATPDREVYSTLYADEESGLIRHHHTIDHPDYVDVRQDSISFTSDFFTHLRRLANIHRDIDHRLAGDAHSHPGGVPKQSPDDKRCARRIWRNQRNTVFIVGVSKNAGGPEEWTITDDGCEVRRQSNEYLVRVRAFSGENSPKQIRLHQDMGQ